jgi:hypothetical protein
VQVAREHCAKKEIAWRSAIEHASTVDDKGCGARREQCASAGTWRGGLAQYSDMIVLISSWNSSSTRQFDLPSLREQEVDW